MAKITSTELIHDGWQKLHLLTVEDGDASYNREVVELADAVCVLPYDPVRQAIMLVRQLRPTALFQGGPAMLLEAPAGLIEDGATPEESGRREVQEETGLRLGELQPLGSFWSAPGSITQRVALFLAPYSPADRLSDGGGLADEHENIEVEEIPFAEALALARNGGIADMKTFCLLQALERQLRG